MVIIADYDRCEGHGECVIAAPEVFDLNDDGDAVIILDDSPAEALKVVPGRGPANRRLSPIISYLTS
ncbi:ferredoxin [Nocardia sp. NPDC004860]|uniref:ferredoxin n=1 Tax=Nocardia sp. NPDC004860 TaxID=3154557 RepID=UPI0033BB531E